jgi:hypothetical protein
MLVNFREGLSLIILKKNTDCTSTLWRYLGTTEKYSVTSIGGICRCTIRAGTERLCKFLKNIFCIQSLFHVEYHGNVTSEHAG